MRSVQVKMKAQQAEITKKLSINANSSKAISSQLATLKIQITGYALVYISFEDEEVEQLSEYSSEELDAFDIDELQKACEGIKRKLREMQPNLSVLQDYAAKMEIYRKKAEAHEDATQKYNELKNQLDGLKKQRLDEFMSGFAVISSKLKEMYQMITMGGNAELELVDSLDPFSEGIVFSVMPPKKSWKNIQNLSGGEKVGYSLIKDVIITCARLCSPPFQANSIICHG